MSKDYIQNKDLICRICLVQITSDYDCIYDNRSSSKSNFSECGILYMDLFNLKISIYDKLPIYLCNYCTLQLKLFNKFKMKAIESNKFLNNLDIKEEFIISDINENNRISEFSEDDDSTDDIYELKPIENENHSKNIEKNCQIIIKTQSEELENWKKKKRRKSLEVNQTNDIELIAEDERIEEDTYDIVNNNNNEFDNNEEKNTIKKINDYVMNEEYIDNNDDNIILLSNRSSEESNDDDNDINKSKNESIQEEFEEIQYLDEELLNIDNNKYGKDNYDYDEIVINSISIKKDNSKNDIDNKNQDDNDKKLNNCDIEFTWFSCKTCDKGFNTKNQLYYHRTNEHGRLKLSCNQCKRKFYSQETLETHLRIHSGLPAYQCSECPKTFNQKAHYEYHMKGHRNERNVQCHLCGKGFITNSDLKIHMRVHNDERRYECDICGRRFRAHTHMTNHRYSHYDEKLECDICHQKYSCPNVLRTHIKAVHLGESPYECEKCNRKFKRKHHLKAHYRVHMRPGKHYVEDHLVTSSTN